MSHQKQRDIEATSKEYVWNEYRSSSFFPKDAVRELSFRLSKVEIISNSKLIIDNTRHHSSEKMIILSYMILFLTFICHSILLVVRYIFEIEAFVISIG